MSKFSVALRLFIITSVSALLLAFANYLTADITKKNQEKAFNESLVSALPSATEFSPADIGDYKNETVKINSVNVGYSDKEHKNLEGYVVSATSSEGYGGEVGVMIGIDKNKKITNVIISSPFSETPGLGANAKKPKFLDQFKGKSESLEVVKRETKADGEIQAISSATITSKAVTSCVNAAMEVVSRKSEKTASAAEEIQKTVKEIETQSNTENDTAIKNRQDLPDPIIAEDANKEEKENEQ